MPVLVHQHRFLVVGKPPTLLHDLLYTLFHESDASPLVVPHDNALRLVLLRGLRPVCTFYITLNRTE